MLKQAWLGTSYVLHSGPKGSSQVSLTSLLTYICFKWTLQIEKAAASRRYPLTKAVAHLLVTTDDWGKGWFIWLCIPVLYKFDVQHCRSLCVTAISKVSMGSKYYILSFHPIVMTQHFQWSTFERHGPKKHPLLHHHQYSSIHLHESSHWQLCSTMIFSLASNLMAAALLAYSWRIYK